MDRLIAVFFEFLETLAAFALPGSRRRLDYQADLRFASPWRKLGIILLIIAIVASVGFVCLMLVTSR